MGVKFSDSNRWIQFSLNGANFALASAEEAAGIAPKGAMVVFEVDSPEEARARVPEFGARVVAERDVGDHGRTLAALDPAGNSIQFFCRAARPGEGNR